MVNPDVGGFWLLDSNSITEIGLYVLDSKIANDDIPCVDGKPEAVQDYQGEKDLASGIGNSSKIGIAPTGILPDDSGVRSDID